MIKERVSLRTEGWDLNNPRDLAKHLQPTAFYQDAEPDEAVLAERLTQIGSQAAVAPEWQAQAPQFI